MTSPESRIKEIRERWDKNGEDDCYSINELFEAIGLAFAQLDLANKRCDILREAVRASLGHFALWNDEENESEWPKYIKICEQALKAADEVIDE